MSYAECKYRMSEAKRRERKGVRAGAGDFRMARRRLTSTWVLMCGACNSTKGAGGQEELKAKLKQQGVIF